MRKFTNKQSIYVDKLLDEAWNDGYKAAEFDRSVDGGFKEALATNLLTIEANMKRAEAEFNKREQVALGYGTPDELYTFWGVRDDH